MDKLACLYAFVSVVESQGFTQAARRSGISKAMISRQVAQLEEHLEVRLLHRTTRQVSTTAIGQAYYEQCRPLLSELSELDNAVQANTKQAKGELRVTAPVTFAELHLMSIVSTFCRNNPQVQLNLQLSDRFVDLVEERIDVAIRIGALHDSTLIARKLGSTAMHICASSHYLKQHGVPSHPQELTQRPCILDSNYNLGNPWTVGQGASAQSMPIHARWVVNSASAALKLVKDGHGIGLLPSFVIANDVKQGNIHTLFNDLGVETLGIYAVYAHRKHLSTKVRLFIDALIAYCDATFANAN